MRCRSRYEQILFASKRAAESFGRAAACAPAVVAGAVVVLVVAVSVFPGILMIGFAGVVIGLAAVAVVLVVASLLPLVVGALGLSPGLGLSPPLAEFDANKSFISSEVLPPVPT